MVKRKIQEETAVAGLHWREQVAKPLDSHRRSMVMSYRSCVESILTAAFPESVSMEILITAGKIRQQDVQPHEIVQMLHEMEKEGLVLFVETQNGLRFVHTTPSEKEPAMAGTVHSLLESESRFYEDVDIVLECCPGKDQWFSTTQLRRHKAIKNLARPYLFQCMMELLERKCVDRDAQTNMYRKITTTHRVTAK